MATYSYLQREEVLKYIDTLHFRTQYIKIIVLDNKECPLRAIEGRATAGSITINGSSAVRRSGSLTLVTALNEEAKTPLDIMNEVTNIDTLISMNKRLQIEIGIENSGNQFKEEKMFWIPFGIFVIQNASVTYNNQGIQISLKLTDKMALLNGELGGTFAQAITHSPMGEYADGEQAIVNKGVKFRTLIEYLLRDFGELEEYEYSIENIPNTVKNIIRWNNPNQHLHILVSEGKTDPITPKPNEMELLSSTNHQIDHVNRIYGYGDNIGYTETDFVYPLDKTLDSKPGETVTSVLDKIKNTLGNYEYFFDIDGIFRFREIPNFLNEGSTINDLTEAIAEKYFINSDISAGRTVYRFNDASLISSYANNPQYNYIKNDYSIWGKTDYDADLWYHLLITEAPDDYETQAWELEVERDEIKGPDGTPIPRALRILSVKSLKANEVTTSQFVTWDPQISNRVIINFAASDRPGKLGRSKDDDWRLKFYFLALEKEAKKRTPFDKEVLEKMPTLYKLASFTSGTFFKPIYDRNNGLFYWLDIVNTNDYKLAQTIDIKNFGIGSIGRKMKTISDNDVNCLFPTEVPNYFWEAPLEVMDKFQIIGRFIPKDTYVDYSTTEGSEYSLVTAQARFANGNPSQAPEKDESGTWLAIIKIGGGEGKGIWEYHSYAPSEKDPIYPSTADGRYYRETFHYLEFLPSNTHLGETYAFTKWFVDNFIGYDDESKVALQRLQKQIDDMWRIGTSDHVFWGGVDGGEGVGSNVALGTVENPAYDLLRSSLHEHLSYNNSINLTTMPVYHLDANDRISVYNKESAIYGDYIINSLTIPLGLEGMMTINARKAVERI